MPPFSSFITILLILETVHLAYSSMNNQDDMGTVIFVNVLHRHGDRTPLDPYPNDPYRNLSYWPVGFGQLTNRGKQQEYELGQWLRKRYDSLLTNKYDPDIVYIQSTDVDRTLMSVESNLAAMFPPNGSQVWNPKLEWQPIPVHTIPRLLDKALAVKAPCPALDEEFNRVLNSDEIQKLNHKFSEVFKILNQYTGRNITTLDDVRDMYDILFIEELYNLTLPSWSKDIYPQPLKDASAYSFVLPTWNTKLARLKSGLLIDEMIKHIKDKKENKLQPNRNVYIYSAHDTTIADLLNTLRVFDVQNPPYASAVMIELRVDANGNHSITLFYRNSTVEEPYLLTLPDCTPVCPLDKFISLCQPIIPEDWDQECQISSDSSPINTLTIIALVVSTLILVLLATAVYCWQRRRRPSHWYQKLTNENL